MNYANTMITGDTERVVTVLPLELVPGFDPDDPPPPFAYTVPDDVQPGWEKQPDGSFAPPAPKPPVVPIAVKLRQARLALIDAGYFSTVDTAISAMPGEAGLVARTEWEYASEVRRDSPLVQKMAAALGLDDAALDALFIQAAGL